MIHGKRYRTSMETYCGLPLEGFVILMLPLPDGTMGECYAENVQEWLDGEICPVCEDASPPTPEDLYQDPGKAPGPDLCAHCEERPREEFKCSRCQLDLCKKCGTPTPRHHLPRVHRSRGQKGPAGEETEGQLQPPVRSLRPVPRPGRPGLLKMRPHGVLKRWTRRQ